MGSFHFDWRLISASSAACKPKSRKPLMEQIGITLQRTHAPNLLLKHRRLGDLEFSKHLNHRPTVIAIFKGTRLVGLAGEWISDHCLSLRCSLSALLFPPNSLPRRICLLPRARCVDRRILRGQNVVRRSQSPFRPPNLIQPIGSGLQRFRRRPHRPVCGGAGHTAGTAPTAGGARAALDGSSSARLIRQRLHLFHHGSEALQKFRLGPAAGPRNKYRAAAYQQKWPGRDRLSAPCVHMA